MDANKVVIELSGVQFWSEIKRVISNRNRAARSFDFEITRCFIVVVVVVVLFCLLVIFCTSGHMFVLSDQNSDLAGHVS